MHQLLVDGASKSFGGLRAISDVSLGVRQAEILGLIGPNGAGKTTLLNCISGIEKLDAGRVLLDDREITRWPAHRRCRAGVARTFQIPRPFPRMTVRDNVLVSALSAQGNADGVLRLMGLSHKVETAAKALTFHERRRLELARALAAEPKFLLLDEVMAGLNPTETAEMVELVRQVRRDFDIGILWVEHVMGAIMECADRIVVLDQGVKLKEGIPKEIADDPDVVEIYLGEQYQFEGGEVAQG